MKQLTAGELSQHLPELVDQLKAGYSLFIEYEGKVIGQVMPVTQQSGPPYRKAGFGKGMFTIADNFDDPIPGFEPLAVRSSTGN